MQRAMFGFLLLYIFEGKHLNNHNLMGKFKMWYTFFIINKK